MTNSRMNPLLPLPALRHGAAVLVLLAPAAMADSLKERQAKVLQVVEKARPSVVCIQARSGAAMGSGSGVIVSNDGIILTAAHVVDGVGGGKGPEEVIIVLNDGREVKAKVLGRDRNRDAAMCKINEGSEWPHVELAKAESVSQGEWCIAMGHPGGFDPQRGAPVRVGRLWQNNDKAYYRSDCTVSGGDSGGPLFDLDGRVIGIHSSISMDLSENRHVPIGVFHDDWERLRKGDAWGNLNKLLSGAEDLTPKKKEKEKPEAAPAEPKPAPREPAPQPSAKPAVWLGIAMDVVDGNITVTQVSDGSPAQKAGIELEDVILKVDGKAVGGTGDIAAKVRAASPGDEITLTVRRKGAEKEVTITLAERK